MTIIFRTGRPRCINSVQIQEVVTNDPTISIRTVARDQGVSQASVCRALKVAHFHPYKITLTQELHINDKARRLRYCRWFLNASEENYHFPSIFCSRTNVFSTIMATSTAIIYITGPPRILTGCSKRIRKSDGR